MHKIIITHISKDQLRIEVSGNEKTLVQMLSATIKRCPSFEDILIQTIEQQGKMVIEKDKINEKIDYLLN